MDRTVQTPPAGSRFAMVVAWLVDQDERKREAAVSILGRLGEPGVPHLVQEAIGANKQAEHRIALLDIIQQIGGPLELDDSVKLRTLFFHRDPAVRDKAEAVGRFMYRGGQQ